MKEAQNTSKPHSFEEAYAFSHEEQHLTPIKIDIKAEYYSELGDIIDSWSGRMDVIYSNKFFIEAKNLIVNAIVLFEKGYFDCAFYSLRQSIEVTLTIAYLADDDDSVNQSEKHKEWNNKKYFPVVSKMIKQLKVRKLNYSDIQTKMSSFFEQLDKEMERMNKYVHKQGYDSFYNHISEEKVNELKKDFISSLEMSISAIAIHRLVIDPLPLLLMDENIYQKSGDLLTEPFSEKFLNKYLINYIAEFKSTQMYQDYYNYFDMQETKLPSVLDIVKNQFVDRDKFEEIISQTHLLSLNDRIAVSYFAMSKKISQIHIGSLGLNWYFSNTKSNRVSGGFNSQDFKIFKSASNLINQSFDVVFYSYLTISSEDIFLEHNEILDENEIKEIEKIQLGFEKSIDEANKKIEEIISLNKNK
jgi:hypothetical protein